MATHKGAFVTIRAQVLFFEGCTECGSTSFDDDSVFIKLNTLWAICDVCKSKYPIGAIDLSVGSSGFLFDKNEWGKKDATH